MDKIICVGKNYLEHAEEMQDGIPEKPVLFLKPASVLKAAQKWQDTLKLILPNDHDEFHYECELVFKIKMPGYKLKNLSLNEAFSHVTVGLDMTNRTLQSIAKKQGAPWTTGKVFPDAAVIGPWISLDEFDTDDLNFSFNLNDSLKQQSNSKEMRMNALDVLQYASEFFPVCSGDLLFTGTPKGVGRVKHNDKGELCLNSNYRYRVEWQ